MKTAIFSTKSYDKQFLTEANQKSGHELVFFTAHLSVETVALANGFPAVCVFVNDCLDATVVEALARQGTKLVALRCAGYNNVDLAAAKQWGITVVRVPAYSPHAIAEHTVGLILDLNRKIHRAYNRVREGNFSLDGLLGFDLNGKTVGIVGTGKIGLIVARILAGFGCRLLAYDPHPEKHAAQSNISYVGWGSLITESDIITLHCPLTPETLHIIDDEAIAQMKPGVMLINTSRGGVINTHAVIEGLKSEKIGYLGLDVYEEEADLFFEDFSCRVIQDDMFSRLLTFPNVMITGHQAFFTREAMQGIAQTTLHNINAFEQSGQCLNRLQESQVT